MATKPKKQLDITDAQRTNVEEQIKALQREVDYQTKEFVVELLVQKYRDGIDEGENEIFIPAYQREFVWSEERQSKFIESVLLGLPVPYIFIANIPNDIDKDDGRAEIVDGSQRIRTLEAFSSNKLKLTGLQKLTTLDNFYFKDLAISRQRKFNRQAIRVIELSDKADEQIRRDIFERINTGSDELRAMETRKGIYSGPFYNFIKECTAREDFKKICPVSAAKQSREEAEELVLRYFAYCDNYLNFKHDVQKFLTAYLQKNQSNFNKLVLKKQFDQMVSFATQHLPHGFSKTATAASTPRVRFEALSCGITLALRIDPKLKPKLDSSKIWLFSPEFNEQVSTDASNSLPRLRGRIEFVRDKLLGS